MPDNGDRARACRECGAPAEIRGRRFCAPCYQDYQSIYYRENRERISAQRSTARRARVGAPTARPLKLNRHTSETLASERLKRHYGLSACDVAEMAERQGGCCAICAQPASLVVDHDHETGRVRALLCTQCNTAIGLFQEDPDRLLAAATYLLLFADFLGVH